MEKNNIVMDIKKLYRIKNELEEKIEEIDSTISSRWRYLMGYRCANFDGWSINEDVINIKRRDRCGDMLEDHPIPIRFFESDKEKSKIAYQEYIDDIKKRKTIKEENDRRKKELKVLKELTKKYRKR